ASSTRSSEARARGRRRPSRAPCGPGVDGPAAPRVDWPRSHEGTTAPTRTETAMTLDRREFLRRAAAQAGALAAGTGALGALGTDTAETSESTTRPATAPAVLRAAPEV